MYTCILQKYIHNIIHICMELILIHKVKTQLTAGKYSITCTIYESVRESKLYARPVPEEENMRKYAQPNIHY